ncbi:MAG: hypothetical protein HF981_03795 [Desulfobacteraceae bacterium]|jgi:hypothetical protein|nr:hypothetical protein [Desulfobacteraceae bacterium]MBC2749486.1 hypothetical protein [Desulfobacteraceae bacterium]
MIHDLEQRVNRLEKGLKKAEAATDKANFRTYLKLKLKSFTDELTFKDWMIVVVAVYLATCLGVLISKGLH